MKLVKVQLGRIVHNVMWHTFDEKKRDLPSSKTSMHRSLQIG